MSGTSKVLKLKAPTVRTESIRGLLRYYGARYLEDNMDLSGDWDVSFKIDGVRMIRGNDDKVYSRRGGIQLEHIQHAMPDHMSDAELFLGDWSTSMSGKAGTVPVLQEHFYSLSPIDDRLRVQECMKLTHEYVASLLEWAMGLGYEGLVLRKTGTNVWLKATPLRYADIMVTGTIEATGELTGMIASFSTKYGRVSCASLTHEQRRWVWQNRLTFIGTIIQARYRERFGGGKLRFAQLERFRPDKDGESL